MGIARLFIGCLVFILAQGVNAHSQSAQQQILIKNGTNRVKLVPRSEMPDIFQKRKTTSFDEDRGYEYVDDPEEILWLLNFDEENHKKNPLYTSMSDPIDTNLKKSLDLVNIGFNFKGIPFVKDSELIGFAVAGTRTAKGWTSVGEIFKSKQLGICSYLIRDAVLSESTATLAMESVSSEVNENITVSSVIGNENYGFLYTVVWFNDFYFHRLECANNKFNPEGKEIILALAKEIDSSVLTQLKDNNSQFLDQHHDKF